LHRAGKLESWRHGTQTECQGSVASAAKESGRVDYPVTTARGLHLPGSGGAIGSAVSAFERRFPHIPTRFASGGWLTTRVGLPNPSHTRGTHYPPGP
jgi:hypothetical protein